MWCAQARDCLTTEISTCPLHFVFFFAGTSLVGSDEKKGCVLDFFFQSFITTFNLLPLSAVGAIREFEPLRGGG